MKILLWGFLAFMVIAVAQEREVFLGALRGEAESAPAAPQAELDAATDAVYLFLSLMRHAYASGGDPRFLERLPASSAVVEELRGDVVYLAHNGRVQDPELMKLEIIGADSGGVGRVRVTTREHWIIRSLRQADGAEADPPRSSVVSAGYSVARQGSSWQVRSWDLVIPPEATAPDEPAAVRSH